MEIETKHDDELLAIFITIYQNSVANKKEWAKLPTFQNHNLDEYDHQRQPPTIPVLSPAMLKNAGKQWDPNCHTKQTFPRDSLYPSKESISKILEDNEYLLSGLENSEDVKKGVVLEWDCAFSSLAMSLMAAMSHLNRNYPTVYKGKLLKGHDVDSLKVYNSLSTMNKLTCNILHVDNWIKNNWSEKDRESAVKNRDILHSKLSSFSKLVFLKYESNMSKSDRNLDKNKAPSLFMHHFIKNCPEAAPLHYEPNPNRNIYERNGSRSSENEWNGGKHNFFSGEWGLFGVGRAEGTDDDFSGVNKVDMVNSFSDSKRGTRNYRLISDDGDNYISSILDYTRFVFQATRYGWKGTPTNFHMRDGNVFKKRASISNQEEKGVILFHLHNNFVHFYSFNLQMEKLLRNISDSPLGLVADSTLLSFSNSRAMVEDLSPNYVPLRSTSYTLEYHNLSKAAKTSRYYEIGTYYPDPRMRKGGGINFGWLPTERKPKNASVSVITNRTVMMQSIVQPFIDKHLYFSSDIQPDIINVGSIMKMKKVSGKGDKKYHEGVQIGETKYPEIKETTHHFYAVLGGKEATLTIPPVIDLKYNELSQTTVKNEEKSVFGGYDYLNKLMGIVHKNNDFSMWSVRAGPAFYDLTLDSPISWEKEYSKSGSDQKMTIVTKKDIEKVINANQMLGHTFKLELGLLVSLYYFGKVKFGIKKSAFNRINYVPVAIIFGNSTLNVKDNAGDTSEGHFWCEIKMPSNYGDTLSEEPSSIKVMKNINTPEWKQTLDKELWFHCNNTMDSGSPNWDILADFNWESKGYQLSETYGGEIKTKDATRDRNIGENYRPVNSDHLAMNIIKNKMVSLGSVGDGVTLESVTPKISQSYKLVKIKDEWYVIFNNKMGNVAKIDSVIYAAKPRVRKY